MKRSEFVYSREQRYTNVIKSLCTAESSAIQKLSRVCVQQRAALYKSYLEFVYSREQRYTQLSITVKCFKATTQDTHCYDGHGTLAAVTPQCLQVQYSMQLARSVSQ